MFDSIPLFARVAAAIGFAALIGIFIFYTPDTDLLTDQTSEDAEWNENPEESAASAGLNGSETDSAGSTMPVLSDSTTNTPAPDPASADVPAPPPTHNSPNVAEAASRANDSAAQSTIRLSEVCMKFAIGLRDVSIRLPPAGQAVLPVEQQQKILQDFRLNQVRDDGQSLAQHIRATGSPTLFMNNVFAFRDQAMVNLKESEKRLQELNGRLDPQLFTILQFWQNELSKQAQVLWKNMPTNY